MTLNDYQNRARSTAFYPNRDHNYIYPVLGLVGEAGETANKIKKIIRDDQGVVSPAKKEEIKQELGDVLWYLSQLAAELKIKLNDVATSNLTKLKSRQKRNCLKGSGDNR